MEPKLIKLTETTYGYYLNCNNNTDDTVIDVVISQPHKEFKGKMKISDLAKHMGESLK